MVSGEVCGVGTCVRGCEGWAHRAMHALHRLQVAASARLLREMRGSRGAVWGGCWSHRNTLLNRKLKKAFPGELNDLARVLAADGDVAGRVGMGGADSCSGLLRGDEGVEARR